MCAPTRCGESRGGSGRWRHTFPVPDYLRSKPVLAVGPVGSHRNAAPCQAELLDECFPLALDRLGVAEEPGSIDIAEFPGGDGGLQS